MTDQLQFDEEESRAVEATYATPDIVEQRRATLAALALEPGERVLDVGCGPGYLAREMAEAVGTDGFVHGVDPSPAMLAIAARRALPHMELSEGDALSLRLPDAEFDVAVSTQVYEYVADIEGALREARRVLRPGGRLLVLDTDWDSIVWRSSDDERMERVLRAWDAHLVHRDLPRRLPELLRRGGFTLARAEAIPVLNVGYRKDTYSGSLLPMVARFVSGRDGIAPGEAQAWADDLTSLGDNYFFSLSRYLFVAARA
ncbi:MAG TPA: methyltransferase domain-containing protein [Thermoleophilaceae bacterium]|nr:methyltransferase domain-containing protein [Thermoleophilaceae bacterium]